MPDDNWTQAELVRVVTRLAEVVERLDNKISHLDERFVSREVFDLRMAVVLAADARIEETDKKLKEVVGDMVSKKAITAILTLIAALAVAAGTVAGALH